MGTLVQSLKNNILFDTLMHGVSDHAFLLNADNLELLAVSQSVCKAQSLDLQALQQKPLDVLIDVTAEDLKAFVSSHMVMAKLVSPLKVDNIHYYRLKHLNIARIQLDETPYLFALKVVSDESKAHPDFDENDTRFKVLVKSTPGLVFEFRIDPEGQISFDYLSEGCKALLGLEIDVLKETPNKFFDIMNKEDFSIFEERLKISAADLSLLNWEGRFWIEEWNDTKWVNLRCSPRKYNSGVVEWSGIMTNITQSKREKAELERSRERLAELSAHLNKVKEEERSRIAREIHDDLGGNLTFVKMGLDALIKQLPVSEEGSIEKTQELKKVIDQTFEAVHRISGDLRPTILELGIVAALDWQAKEFEKQMEIPCTFVTNELEADSTKEQAIALFRICQEAMSNIAKYANASRVDVALLFSRENIQMYVTDDGIGIDSSDVMKPNAFGLRGMEERVAALQGKFSIERAPEKGTNITVILPN